MGIVSVYPQSERAIVGMGSGTGGRTITGAASAQAALDASDTSYIQSVTASTGALLRYGFANPSIPANAHLQQMRVAIRVARSTANMTSSVFWLGIQGTASTSEDWYTFPNPYPPSNMIPTTNVFGEYTTPWISTLSAGQPWEPVRIWYDAAPTTSSGRWEWAVMVALWSDSTGVYDTGTRLSMCRLDVQYNEAPAVTVTSPSGTIVTTQPDVLWNYSDPENDPKVKHNMKIFHSSVYGGAGFSPDTSTAVFDTGAISDNASGDHVDYDLNNGNTYKAYVKCWQPDIVGWPQYSPWASSSAFTLTLDPPAVPSVVAVADDANARLIITVQDLQNELSANAASVETSVVDWSVLSNCTVSRSTAQASNGVASLQVQSSAAGDALASTAQTTSAIPVLPNVQYTAMADCRQLTAPAARNCRVDIMWWTVSGLFISTSSSTTVQPTTTAWSRVTVTATSPGTAAFASVRVGFLTAAAANEQFLFDRMGLMPGTSTNWFAGGFDSSINNLFVERSEDPGAGTIAGGWIGGWQPMRGSPFVGKKPVGQQIIMYEYEIPRGKTIYYRARVSSTWNANFVVSDLSPVVSVAPTFNSFWLKDPTDSTRNIAIMIDNFKLTYAKPNVVSYPVGTSWPANVNTTVMSHDGVKSAKLSGTIHSLNATQYAALQLLISSGRTLLLQDVLGRQWYVQPDDNISWAMLRAVKLPTETTPVRHAHELDINFIDVGSV